MELRPQPAPVDDNKRLEWDRAIIRRIVLAHHLGPLVPPMPPGWPAS